VTHEPRLTLKALVARLVPMCAMYRADWDAVTIEEFFQALADLPEVFVLQALRDLVKTEPFMPRPAEIRDRVAFLRRDAEEEARRNRRALPPHEETPEEHTANLALIRATIDQLTVKALVSPRAHTVRSR
jgi:hypothetical protein